MFFHNKNKLADLQSEPTTVLVADDDPITRQLLKRFLEEKGHEVLVAEDGEQAWSLFVTHHPRLVLTDWRMPKLDGLGLCQRIRQDETADYTFVLILTSTTDRDAMVKGVAAGADDFMTKPFDRAELTWRIYSGMRVLDLQNSLENRIRQLDEARERLESANSEMKEGLDAAAKTQRALLPKSPPAVTQIDSAWSYEPSDHLGGDSLNVFKLTDTRFGFFVADVCGHGLPSALLAVSLHRVLTPVLSHAGLLQTDGDDDPIELFSDPGRVLTKVNQRFPMKIEDGEYFTAVYGVIDTETSELSYCGAGHPSPIVMSADGTIKQLAADGFPIGFDEGMEYETQTVRLQAGDRLVVYTDGILEAASPSGERFEIDRLIDILRKTKDTPIKKLIAQLNHDVEVFAGDLGQQDDLSIVAVEFQGTASETTAAATSDDGISTNHV